MICLLCFVVCVQIAICPLFMQRFRKWEMSHKDKRGETHYYKTVNHCFIQRYANYSLDSLKHYELRYVTMKSTLRLRLKAKNGLCKEEIKVTETSLLCYTDSSVLMRRIMPSGKTGFRQDINLDRSSSCPR